MERSAHGRPSFSPNRAEESRPARSEPTGRRRQQPRGGHGARSGWHRNRYPLGLRAQSSTPRAATASPSTVDSWRRAISCHASPPPKCARPTTGSHCNRSSAWSSNGCSPDELDGRHTGLAPRRHPGRVLRAGRRLHRRPEQRARLHRGTRRNRVDVRGRCATTGLRTAGGRVIGVDTSAVRSTPTASCSPAARSSLRSAPAQAAGSRPRHPPPGRRHRQPARPGRQRLADGVRPDVGNLLAARRRTVGCSGA